MLPVSRLQQPSSRAPSAAWAVAREVRLAAGLLFLAVLSYVEFSAEMFSFQHRNLNTFYRELFYVSIKRKQCRCYVGL